MPYSSPRPECFACFGNRRTSVWTVLETRQVGNAQGNPWSAFPKAGPASALAPDLLICMVGLAGYRVVAEV